MPESPTRVLTWTLRSDADRVTFDHWAGLVRAARHPALARVEEVGRTEDTGRLVLVDPDSEDVADWADRTEASVPERLTVLRAAAAALDALYAGDGSGAGVPHGGISADSVRVTTDGATRIVGFGPWVHADRYLAPELEAGASPTRSADAYAFARLVAEVLGGAQVVGAADGAAVVRALRVAPDTRRRARLIKSINAALTEPAETRPHSLTGWLAAAVEGTAATEVRGATPEPVPVDVAPHPVRTGARTGWVVAGIALAVAVGIGIWASGAGGDDPPPAATPTSGTGAGPFQVTGPAWSPPCGAGSGVAGESDLATLREQTNTDELDRSPRSERVGRWHEGRVVFGLRMRDPGATATILGVEAQPVTRIIEPPAWIVRSAASCANRPGPEPVQVYRRDFAAEKSEVAELGPADLSNPDTGSFRLRDEETVLALDVSACVSNVEWQVVVRYSEDDQVREQPLDGLFDLYGDTPGADQYDLPDGNGLPVRSDVSQQIGPDRSCAAVD